ncbi:hypothetical protein FRC07_005856, partial [Ceratobasidium sp. 392]
MAVGYYSLASLDLFGVAMSKPKEKDRKDWAQWIWAQYISTPEGTGFRGGDSLALSGSSAEATIGDPANLIMTYAALLTLSILRDDFSRLDKSGLLRFVASCQNSDGSFSPTTSEQIGDLRVLYTAFVICYLLDSWSAINVPAALEFIRRCRSYEGGYGQSPDQEAH